MERNEPETPKLDPESFPLDMLPLEMLLLIFSFCPTKSIFETFCVCKALSQIGGDEEKWKQRSIAEKAGQLQNKGESQNWKQFYFKENVKLFPLFGCRLGYFLEEVESSIQETQYPNPLVIDVPESEGAKRVVVDGRYTLMITGWHEFYVAPIFQIVKVKKNSQYKWLPTEWKVQGLTMEKSLNEYIVFIERWTGQECTPVPTPGGYYLIVENYHEPGSCPYKIEFVFDFTQVPNGNADSRGTFMSLTIRRASHM